MTDVGRVLPEGLEHSTLRRVQPSAGVRGRPQRPHTHLTRRVLLSWSALGMLAACSSADPEPSTSSSLTPTTRPRVAPADRNVRWASWPEYIDVDDAGGHPSLDAFTADTGIPVTYTEPIGDNVEYVDSIRSALTSGTDVGADALTLTSWMCAQLARAGELQPFGPITSADRVLPALARPDWDRDQSLSMPWQSGLTGIAYDARNVDRAIGSVAELFTREDLAGKVSLLTEYDDAVGFALLGRGQDVATASASTVGGALDFLEAQQSAGRFAGFYGNEYLDALASGEVIAAQAWSGDILQAQSENPYLKFVIPEEGLLIWSDNFVVPAGSIQAEAVAALVDYYYRPEVAAQVAAQVNYICPVVGAQAAMAEFDQDLAASPLIFPDPTILDRSYRLPTLATNDETALRARLATLTEAAGGE